MDTDATELRQPVREVIVEEDYAGQRIDNFLHTALKGVPRARIYRILRRGEVRVNRGRIRQGYRLQAGDVIRIPPLRYSPVSESGIPTGGLLRTIGSRILFEDDGVLVIDKPHGLAVHGGSGQRFGVIEALRALRPDSRTLELVHRLDRDTSGCLLIAKKRSSLRRLHESLRRRQLDKRYLLLVKGRWRGGARRSEARLRKNILSSGERVVRVHPEGKPAVTLFRPLSVGPVASVLEARTLTGRTHQIRVQAAAEGHPIAGDPKYGDPIFDRRLRENGLVRLFLHASSLSFSHAAAQETLRVEAPLDPALARVLDSLGLAKG